MTVTKMFSKEFKKLRLQSGIDSLRELCELLVEFDFVLEESTLSRWQNGNRVPRNRNLVLGLIKIFAIRGALSTVDEANRFLYFAKLVPLSDNEKKMLSLKNKNHLIFVLPPKPELIGIENIEYEIHQKVEKNKGHLKVVLWGLPGTGKSSSAILMAHQLQSFFQKGIIWIRVLDKDITTILNELENILEANILSGSEENIHSLIKSKEFLIVFDNVGNNRNLEDIVKKFEYASYLITTSFKPQINNHFSVIKVGAFDKRYAVELFSRASGRNLQKREIQFVEKISNQVGNLPLPLSIVANTISNSMSEQTLEMTLGLLKQKQEGLLFFRDNFSQIIIAFELLFEKLNEDEKLLLKLISKKRLPIFKARDISSSSFDLSKVKWAIFTLSNKSLINATSGNSYKIHPVLYRFLRINLD